MIISVPEFDVQPESGPSQARVGKNPAESGKIWQRQAESGRLEPHSAESSQSQTGIGLDLGPSGARVGPESEAGGAEAARISLLRALDATALSRSQLSAALGHKSISRALNARIRNMLTEELIEYTIPDKPNSRLQKYRLTEKGWALLPQNQA